MTAIIIAKNTAPQVKTVGPKKGQKSAQNDKKTPKKGIIGATNDGNCIKTPKGNVSSNDPL